ncbi:DUF2061 domain-containing protein [Neisseria sicca]|uniref:DUF2061 domain-containing protein n=1 Tax=Neisseria sicca TaxID=490 RepID=UPI0028FC1036|nr:DUF2061 domain-containing protein [Neisseria sicca]
MTNHQTIIIKTITFPILHFPTPFPVPYIFTPTIPISTPLPLLHPLPNTLLFYFHQKTSPHYQKSKTLKHESTTPLHHSP